MLFELKEMATEPVPHVMKATCPGVERRDAIVVVAGRQQINLPTALGDACSHAVRADNNRWRRLAALLPNTSHDP
jgi:hypothetical protein